MHVVNRVGFVSRHRETAQMARKRLMISPSSSFTIVPGSASRLTSRRSSTNQRTDSDFRISGVSTTKTSRARRPYPQSFPPFRSTLSRQRRSLKTNETPGEVFALSTKRLPCRRLKRAIRKTRNRRRTKIGLRMCRHTSRRKASGSRSAAGSEKRPDAKAARERD